MRRRSGAAAVHGAGVSLSAQWDWQVSGYERHISHPHEYVWTLQVSDGLNEAAGGNQLMWASLQCWKIKYD